MSADHPESVYRKPSLFSVIFSLVGSFIAVSVFAGIITSVEVICTDWGRYKFSIFGLAWGVCARLL